MRGLRDIFGRLWVGLVVGAFVAVVGLAAVEDPRQAGDLLLIALLAVFGLACFVVCLLWVGLCELAGWVADSWRTRR